VVWLHGEARVIRDAEGRPVYIQGVAYDITERERASEALRRSSERIRASLAEKEVLLKEVHHRVKNNIQVIASLLKLQSAHIRDPQAVEMFNDSRNRVQSMALVHEKLYRSDDLARIDFGEYVEGLAKLLLRSYRSRANPIALDTQIENMPLGIDVAVPLGLILNELISNSLKYAFPDETAGTIRVELHHPGANRHELTVADDGVGLPNRLDVLKTGTLGMQLVRTLVQQIGGTLQVRSDAGTEFRISFPG
jgi:two-component sensor histidine kinase